MCASLDGGKKVIDKWKNPIAWTAEKYQTDEMKIARQVAKNSENDSFGNDKKKRANLAASLQRPSLIPYVEPVLNASQPHHSINVPNTAFVGLLICFEPFSPKRFDRGPK